MASAIRLTARSDLTEPSASTTRAEGGPKRLSRKGSIATRSPSSAPPAIAAGTWNSGARRTLLDRQCAARSVVGLAEDGVDARLQLVENLDHAARIGRLFSCGVGIELDAHQHARAKPGRRRGLALAARAAHQDQRRGAVLAPLGGPGDELAVAVAPGDVGDDERGQAALNGQRLAAARDGALRLQVLDQELELGLGVPGHAEGAGDVALGDARAGLLALRRRLAGDEGDQLLARRQGGFARSAAAGALRRASMRGMILQGFHSGPQRRPGRQPKFEEARKQAATLHAERLGTGFCSGGRVRDRPPFRSGAA